MGIRESELLIGMKEQDKEEGKEVSKGDRKANNESEKKTRYIQCFKTKKLRGHK